MTFGQKLKQLRTERRFSLRGLGKQAGVSYVHISDYEHDRININFRTFKRLVQALNVSFSEFDNCSFEFRERKNARRKASDTKTSRGQP